KQAGVVAEVAETRVPDKDGTQRERVFKKGEVLLRLKSEMAEYQLGKARAAVKAAEAELERAKKGPALHKLKLELQETVITGYEHEKKKLEADLDDKKKTYEQNFGNVTKNMLTAIQESVASIDARIKGERQQLEMLKLADPDIDIRRATADLDARRNDEK